MKRQYILAALAAMGLSVATNGVIAQGHGAGSGQVGGGQGMRSDRMIDRDTDRNRDRVDQARKDKERLEDQRRDQDKDRVAQPDQRPNAAGDGQQQRDQSQQHRIYGQELMSVEERNEYQERLRMIDSDEERGRFIAEHRESMQQRAKAKGVALEDPETEESE